jgi:hypothetical protein
VPAALSPTLAYALVARVARAFKGIKANQRRSVVITPIIRRLLSALVVIGASMAMPATAPALPTVGPFWQVNGTQLPVGTSKAIVGKGVGGTMYSTIANVKIKFTCEEVTASGFIFNTTTKGESQETQELKKNCHLFTLNGKQEYILQSGCGVDEPIRILQSVGGLWYRTRVNNQRSGATERTATEQTRFAPGPGGVFTTVTVTEAPECIIPVIASVGGSVAAEGKPEQTEVMSGRLIFPSEQQKHVWRPTGSQIEETQLGLIFGKEEARIEDEVTLELVSGERAGTIE